MEVIGVATDERALALHEKSVHVAVLRLDGSKKLTAAFLKQLPILSIINDEGTLRGEPWGMVDAPWMNGPAGIDVLWSDAGALALGRVPRNAQHTNAYRVMERLAQEQEVALLCSSAANGIMHPKLVNGNMKRAYPLLSTGIFPPALQDLGIMLSMMTPRCGETPTEFLDRQIDAMWPYQDRLMAWAGEDVLRAAWKSVEAGIQQMEQFVSRYDPLYAELSRLPMVFYGI